MFRHIVRIFVLIIIAIQSVLSSLIAISWAFYIALFSASAFFVAYILYLPIFQHIYLTSIHAFYAFGIAKKIFIYTLLVLGGFGFISHFLADFRNHLNRGVRHGPQRRNS